MTDRWHPGRESRAGESWHRETTWARSAPPSRARSGITPARLLQRVGKAAAGATFVALGALLLSGASQAPLNFANASATVVQSFGAANSASGSATLSVKPTAATGGGDLLVAVIRTRNTTNLAPVSSVTDSASNHWVLAPNTKIAQGSQADQEIWYTANAAALATSQSIIVTVGGTSAATSAIAFTVLDVTGAAATPLDVSASKGGSTQPASTGITAATTQASEIVIGDLGWNSNSVTVSGQQAGYTVLPLQSAGVSGSGAGEEGAWKLVSATGTQSYSATLSSSSVAWTGAIATFKTGAPTTTTITGFSPPSGPVGTVVTITGAGFTGATVVKFNTTTATTFSVTDDGHLNATVPTGATSGFISVTAPGGTASSSPTSFTVTAPTTTTITGFSPPSGPVGTVVTITGAGFTGATVVKFNTTTATTFSVTDDGHLNATVPTGATSGFISVTAPGGTASSSPTSFTVTAPTTTTITGFSPPSGPVGTVVTITGAGFTGATVVKFNTTTATTFSVTDDGHLNATVPTGATSGFISVTAPGGTASSSPTSFTVTTPPTAPHVMLIVEENHSYSGTGEVIGNSQAPYINSLAQSYLSSTSWYSPYHGSPLDYTSLIAGNTDGSITKPSSDTTFVDELTGAGLTWGAYFEAMPFSCDTANWPTGSNSSNAMYALDHNPFTYYSSTRTTAACQNNVPVAAPSTIPAGPNDPFATLMGSNSLPDFMFVVPDNCDEMHSECPANGNNEPSNADAWLKYNMPAIQASNWYKQGGVVIITWDEAYHTDDFGMGQRRRLPVDTDCSVLRRQPRRHRRQDPQHRRLCCNRGIEQPQQLMRRQPLRHSSGD